MIQLAFLLVGMQAIQGQWRKLAIVGALWSLLGVAIIVEPLDGIQNVTMHVLGGVLVIEGVVVFLAGMLGGVSGWQWAVRAVALIIPGLLVIDTPFRNVVVISILFGIALVIDGTVRLISTLMVRYPGWRVGVAGAAIEFVLALLAVTPWPVSYEATVPFCCGVALLLSGWTILRSALLLRSMPADAPITALPLFDQRRGWHLPPLLPGPTLTGPTSTGPTSTGPTSTKPASGGPAWPPADDGGPRLTVHVWTPVGGASGNPLRRPLLDRYVAAVDKSGMISTGHASLEMPPNLYISHYRMAEQDRSSEEFREALLATAKNDVPGRFLPSYQAEIAEWWDATEHIAFTRFDAERLRAFWALYRTDTTYNLTNRNCSIVVAMALDVALEGVLGRDRVWRRLVALILHPDLHIANLLRKRAVGMTWTPGLVLDYARSLQKVVEPSARPWLATLRDAAVGLVRARRDHPKTRAMAGGHEA